MLELEENLHRKDLTAHERSKAIVQTVEAAKQVAREEAATAKQWLDDQPQRNGTAKGQVGASGNVPKTGGRPRIDPAATREKIAERMGVPERTVRDAEQHVAIADRYPAAGRRGLVAARGGETCANRRPRAQAAARVSEDPGMRIGLLCVSLFATVLVLPSCATAHAARWCYGKSSVHDEPDSYSKEKGLVPLVGVPLIVGSVAFDAVTFPFQAIFGVWPWWGSSSKHMKPD